MKYLRCTLVQVVDGDRILLGLKKRGFGVGKWNGFGGKIEKGESLVKAAMRELQEECGLIVNEDDVRQIGMILFDFVGDDFLIEMNIFKTERFSGTVQESEEMKPQWFPVTQIPFDEMWADDIDWYPIMLRGDMFYGHMKFKGHEVILNEDITLVSSLKEMHSIHEKTLEAYPIKTVNS